MVGAITSFHNIDMDNINNLRAGFLNHSVKTSCFSRPVTGSRSKNLIISMGRIIQDGDINKNLGSANAIRFGLGGTADKLERAKSNIIRAIISKECSQKGISEDKLKELMAQIRDQDLHAYTTIGSLRDMARRTMDAFAAIPQNAQAPMAEAPQAAQKAAAEVPQDVQEQVAEAPQNPKDAAADTQVAHKNTHPTAPKANPKNDNFISFMGGTVLQQVAKKGSGIEIPELKKVFLKNIGVNENVSPLPLIDRSAKISSTLIEKLQKNIFSAKEFEKNNCTNDVLGKLVGEVINFRREAKIYTQIDGKISEELKENETDSTIELKAKTIKERFNDFTASEKIQEAALGIMKYICEDQYKEFSPKGTEGHALEITLMKNADKPVTLTARRGDISLLTVSLDEQGQMTIGDGSGMNFPDDEPQVASPDVRQQQNVPE